MLPVVSGCSTADTVKGSTFLLKLSALWAKESDIQKESKKDTKHDVRTNRNSQGDNKKYFQSKKGQ